MGETNKLRQNGRKREPSRTAPAQSAFAPKWRAPPSSHNGFVVALIEESSALAGGLPSAAGVTNDSFGAADGEVM